MVRVWLSTNDADLHAKLSNCKWKKTYTVAAIVTGGYGSSIKAKALT